MLSATENNKGGKGVINHNLSVPNFRYDGQRGCFSEGDMSVNT